MAVRTVQSSHRPTVPLTHRRTVRTVPSAAQIENCVANFERLVRLELNLAGNPLAIHEGAVLRIQIFERVFRFFAGNPAVSPRCFWVFDHDIAFDPAPDDHRFPFSEIRFQRRAGFPLPKLEIRG